MGGDHGWHWRPSWRDEELRKKLYDLKAVEGEDQGDPHGPYEEYYPSGCSWLKHRLLEITGNLGAVTKHYKPPTIKDALGYDYDKYYQDEDSEEDEACNGDWETGEVFVFNP